MLVGAVISASDGKTFIRLDIPAGKNLRDAALMTLEPGDAATVKLTAVKGCAQLEQISFPG